MHYIPGTKIAPTNRETGSGHRSLSKFKSAKKKVGPFIIGREYEFWAWQKTPQDTFKYRFKDLSSTEIVDMTFDTMLKADEWIAGMRGEELPDYSKFYD